MNTIEPEQRMRNDELDATSFAPRERSLNMGESVKVIDEVSTGN